MFRLLGGHVQSIKSHRTKITIESYFCMVIDFKILYCRVYYNTYELKYR
jgi:hypothetical protein